MRLRKLTIRTLPGIEPGFTFEPPGGGVNLVVGPNASGKSSLTRALGYLLDSRKDDPAALSLEAEFEAGDTRWQVIRNGSQIAWQRGGAPASRLALPAAEQINRYRLSVESLLDRDDAGDRELAARLRRELLGNLDLDALREENKTGQRFGRREANVLVEAAKARSSVENEYRALQRQEAELPDLQRRIDAAAAADSRRQHLEHALKLVGSIEARVEREERFKRFPPEMARLHGEELDRIDAREKKLEELRQALRERRREREVAEADLEGTGQAQAAPAPDELQAANDKLRALDKLSTDRDNARDAAVKAEAAVQDAREQLGGSGEPPRIEDDACRSAEAIAAEWIGARQRLTELRRQLELAGEAPDALEIDRLRDGARALRDWLAGRKARAEPEPAAPRPFPWVAAGAAAAAALAAGWAAYLQAVPAALVAALAALLAVAEVWLAVRGGSAPPPPTENPEDRFRDTGLDPPQRWDEPAVRQHLRDVENEWDARRVLQKRAEGAERIRADIEAAQTELDRQETAKADLAARIGFDPTLPMVYFERFVRLCAAWDQARTTHREQTARLVELDREIAETARGVRVFLDGWPADDATGDDGNDAERPPELDLLRAAYERLRQRISDADAARSTIRECNRGIDALHEQIAEVENEVEQAYAAAGCDAGDRAGLAARLEQWPEWKEAKLERDEAATAERLARDQLVDQPDLIALADAGERARLQTEHASAAGKANEHTKLIQEQQALRTKLEDAGSDLKLERAATAEDRARQVLEDKREEALLAEATALLLDDVEQAFESEHEPDILRRAREIFGAVTAHAFELHLHADGTFAARDTGQDAVRTLGELSSGTRMQLLLALRLAWTETVEQGGETLPLFLDEALTTSDRERFGIMAQSLERIAGADDGRQRQIFYLSARRDEVDLWREATGAEPAVIDLAEIRFGAAAADPENYRVEEPPRIPVPRNGETTEAYAGRLSVPRFDPRRAPGGAPLFYLLRDDLPLLHVLMDTWRVATLGQITGLFASDAAHTAVADEALRHRLRQRCEVVRVWIELWRQGRGRPVDRGALEQCAAISDVFIDRVADLAEDLHGDGAALVGALRAGDLPRFHTSKVDDLEQWLADEGYTDDRERLEAGARRRLALQGTAPATDDAAGDVNCVVDWLESAAGWLEPAANTRG